MVRQLLGVVMLGCALAACSSAPVGPEPAGTEQDESVGTVSLPLLAKQGGFVYRLRLATFTITGPALGGKTRIVKPLADIEVHNEVLPIGKYSIQLEKGWVLERKADADTVYTTVEAQLVTPNPLNFEVNGKVTADALFGFVTASGDVAFGSGSVDIHIGVQDCSSIDGYTAALGTLTADCLGTIDPFAYQLNSDGYLFPTFEFCPNDPSKEQTKIHSIRRLLSLQYKSARLPLGKACMAGRYEVFLKKFKESGNAGACPQFRYVSTENPITPEVIDRVIKMLPQTSDQPMDPKVLALLKTVNLYEVFYEKQPTGSKCQGAVDCALACGAAFPGFIIERDPTGKDAVRTDPQAWTLDTTYPTAPEDPYLKATYWHPMSYWGGAPGVSFGDYARFTPCVGVGCRPESCSYWTGSHKIRGLQADCNDYTNPDTCTSYCGPDLPVPAGTTPPAL